MNMLAQLPDPNHFSSIGWVAVILTGLILSLRAGMGFIRDLKDKPSPGEVQGEAHQTFATKIELQTFSDRHDAEIKRLYDKREEDLRLAAQQRKSLHEDVQKISSGMAALTATNQLQNQTLAGVTADIKTLLSRMPRVHER